MNIENIPRYVIKIKTKCCQYKSDSKRDQSAKHRAQKHAQIIVKIALKSPLDTLLNNSKMSQIGLLSFFVLLVDSRHNNNKKSAIYSRKTTWTQSGRGSVNWGMNDLSASSC